MIQFNLLPDVKLEYIRVRRTQRLVIGTALVASGAALAVFLMLFLTVDVLQRQSMANLTADISKYGQQVRNTPNINRLLTVQNQLQVLPSLHDQKAVASRLFGYMQQVTPTVVTISDLSVDFTKDTMSITGQSASLDAVNTYADTLKFTTYSTADHQVSGKKAFSDVVLSNFSRNSQGATYNISLNYDPAIFSNASGVTLSVPNIVSTRSTLDQPLDIFKQAPPVKGNGQ